MISTSEFRRRTGEVSPLLIIGNKGSKERIKIINLCRNYLFPVPTLLVDFEWDKRWANSSIRTGSLNPLFNNDEDKVALAHFIKAGKENDV